MPSIITYSELRAIAAEYDTTSILKEASSRIGKTVFLSHSSKDNDILPGVIRILEGHRGRVYADILDSDLDQNDFTKTAERLRSATKTCRKFVLLVTPRTKDSKWIPWELGLGDGSRGEQNVSLFPSEEGNELLWSQQEYLGLYQRILWGRFRGEEKDQWMVYNHHNNIGIKLEEWISQ